MVAEVMEGIQREQRRYELAVRLIGLQVRTRTISIFTAFSRHQLAVLRQRLGVAEETRHRGPPPSSLQIFTHSARGRTEGAVLVYYCRKSRALLRRGDLRMPLSLEFGERLCDAYEIYCDSLPDPLVDFEELLALILGLAKGDVIALSRCGECQATILIDRLSRRRHICSFCLERELAIAPELVEEDLLVADGQAASPESAQTELF